MLLLYTSFCVCVCVCGSGPEYEHILAEVRGKTGLITLNRPKALNALCTPLMQASEGGGRGEGGMRDSVVSAWMCEYIYAILYFIKPME